VRPKDIGSELLIKTGVRPDEDAGGTTNGPAIDRQGFESAVLVLDVGDAEGSPTSFTVDAKLQHSDQSGSGFTDLSGAAVTQVTAANTLVAKKIDLSGAKRYIRAVTTVSFTGGTSPNVARAALVILGGADVVPTSLT